tara:strand:+ start:3336 stop:3479 length:144 start_codon:yes stop_codon:yes gene_type:complete
MKIIIELEFEKDSLTQEDIRDYVNELVEDACLNAFIVDDDGEYVKDV